MRVKNGKRGDCRKIARDRRCRIVALVRDLSCQKIGGGYDQAAEQDRRSGKGCGAFTEYRQEIVHEYEIERWTEFSIDHPLEQLLQTFCPGYVQCDGVIDIDACAQQ